MSGSGGAALHGAKSPKTDELWSMKNIVGFSDKYILHPEEYNSPL